MATAHASAGEGAGAGSLLKFDCIRRREGRGEWTLRRRRTGWGALRVTNRLGGASSGRQTARRDEVKVPKRQAQQALSLLRWGGFVKTMFLDSREIAPNFHVLRISSQFV